MSGVLEKVREAWMVGIYDTVDNTTQHHWSWWPNKPVYGAVLEFYQNPDGQLMGSHGIVAMLVFVDSWVVLVQLLVFPVVVVYTADKEHHHIA